MSTRAIVSVLHDASVTHPVPAGFHRLNLLFRLTNADRKIGSFVQMDVSEAPLGL
jgi:hypothetical protein